METMKKQNNSATIENTGSTNLIKLSLKKPKHWKWALTTPDSATEPRAPDILLFDHEGNLLVDTRWRKKQHFNNSLKSISFSERHSFTSKFVSNPDNVEGTTDLTHSIGKTRVIEAAENFVRSSYGNNKQRKSRSNEKSLKSTTEKLELSKDKAREIIAYRLKDNVISIGERIDGCPTHKGRNIQSNLKNTAPDLSNKKISIVGEKFEEGNVGDLLLEVSSLQNNIGDTGNHFNEMKMGLNKSKNSRDSFKKNKGRKKSINTHLPNEEDLLLKKSGEVPNSLSNTKNDLNEVNIGFNESGKSRGSFKKNKGGKLEGDKDVKQNSLDISQQSLEKNVGKRLDENTSSHEVGGGFIVTRDITGKHIAFPKPKKESSRVNNENDSKNKCARKVSFDKEGNKLKFVLDDKQEAMGDSAYSGMKKGEEIHGDILSCTDFNKNGGDIVGKLGALPSSDCSEMAIYSCLPSCGSFLRRSKSCKSEKISNPCSRRVSYCDELSDVRKIEVRMTARKKSRERRKLLTKQRSESRGSSSSSCSSSKERTVRPPRSRRKNKRKDRSQSGKSL
ncbi:uncharacterized protein LOC120353589 isoform X2 [Nilaparvata lugens]|uniref:uncharacterized protein LOC120353589 isoform X2 n=1 Tax=Nilaparvata lugens TaxID=108931 RepID=UPI00193D40D6|nr:uncharacterized protein LOC120353589 isoform X2 [Nilaparvata lugens]